MGYENYKMNCSSCINGGNVESKTTTSLALPKHYLRIKTNEEKYYEKYGQVMDIPKSIIIEDFDEILTDKAGAVNSRSFKPSNRNQYKFTVNNAKGSLRVLSNYSKFPQVSLKISIEYGGIQITSSNAWTANVNSKGNFSFSGDMIFYYTPSNKDVPTGTPLTNWKFVSSIYVDEQGVMNVNHINGVATSQNLEVPACTNCA